MTERRIAWSAIAYEVPRLAIEPVSIAFSRLRTQMVTRHLVGEALVRKRPISCRVWRTCASLSTFQEGRLLELSGEGFVQRMVEDRFTGGAEIGKDQDVPVGERRGS